LAIWNLYLCGYMANFGGFCADHKNQNTILGGDPSRNHGHGANGAWAIADVSGVSAMTKLRLKGCAVSPRRMGVATWLLMFSHQNGPSGWDDIQICSRKGRPRVKSDLRIWPLGQKQTPIEAANQSCLIDTVWRTYLLASEGFVSSNEMMTAYDVHDCVWKSPLMWITLTW